MSDVSRINSPPTEVRILKGVVASRAARVEAATSAAMMRYQIQASWSAVSLPLSTQAVLKRALTLAESISSSSVAAGGVDHLRC